MFLLNLVQWIEDTFIDGYLTGQHPVHRWFHDLIRLLGG